MSFKQVNALNPGEPAPKVSTTRGSMMVGFEKVFPQTWMLRSNSSHMHAWRRAAVLFGLGASHIVFDCGDTNHIQN